MQQVLVVGGSGRIGSAVARDLFTHTQARIVLAGREPQRLAEVSQPFGARGGWLQLDLDTASTADLAASVRGFDLVLQCVGPFRQRPPALLLACLAAGVDYVDVCDDLMATRQRLGYDASARAAGVTALIDTGTFPGIDNVLVADALARHPEAESVQLAFHCAGSGGGGFGVLQTTFLAVNRPYRELRKGRWVEVPSYRQRRMMDFGPPLGRRPVYSFEVPELWTLAESFPQLRSLTSRFGTAPDLWNWATFALARAPASLRADTAWLDLAAGFTLPWVHRLDRFVGEALGIRIDVRGRGVHEVIHFFAPSTTEAVGWATGAAAQMVLDGTVRAHGVLLPERSLPPTAYLAALTARGGRLTIRQQASPITPQLTKE